MIAFLKYLIIFIIAVSGALGVLVDFKKEGKVIKFGWISLVGCLPFCSICSPIHYTNFILIQGDRYLLTYRQAPIWVMLKR